MTEFVRACALSDLPDEGAIGVDIGGSGIKAAAVDLDTGEIVSQRHRVPTPQPSAPAAVIASIARLVKRIGAEASSPHRRSAGRPWTARPHSPK